MDLERGESSYSIADTEMRPLLPTGADLPANSEGNGVPCLHWKQNIVVTSWPNKETYHDKINVVAIGQFHRNCEGLHFTDERKSDILAWMKRVFTLDEEMYLTEINNNIRNNPQYRSYLSSIAYSWEEFSKMLLLDSCFIFFTLKRLGCDSTVKMHNAIKDLEPQGTPEQLIDLRAQTERLAADIFIFREQIMLDFIIFGNQIPFIAVTKLIETNNKLQNFVDTRSIRDLAVSFFGDLYPQQSTDLNLTNSTEFDHLLHLFHWSRIPAVKKYEIIEDKLRTPYIPSATELQESGITFKKKISGSFLDINFEEGLFKITGWFRIPVVHINEYSEITFRSLLDFEQGNTNHNGAYFTAYTSCMAHLLRSEDDVKLLKKNRILPNAPITGTEVVKFFEGLKRRTEITKDICDLHNMYKIVRGHNESTRSQNYGQFKILYCSNLWVNIGFIIFCFLTLLTVMQTTFATIKFIKGK